MLTNQVQLIIANQRLNSRRTAALFRLFKDTEIFETHNVNKLEITPNRKWIQITDKRQEMEA